MKKLQPWRRAACLLAASTLFMARAAAENPVTRTGVEIRAGRLTTLDGRPFTVKGVELLAVLAPAGVLDRPVQAAWAHFGEAELERARSWGVNTIAFSVSQAGLDPRSRLYSDAYLRQISGAVGLARRLGFVVILHIRDHGGLGARYGAETNAEGMPDDSTLRADLTAGRLFGDDPGVVIELYTEPKRPPSPSSNWTLWRDGGRGQFSEIVGMQTIISTLRSAGVRNVLAVDGLWYSKSFDGAPPLADPLDQVFYAVHPYINPRNSSPEQWRKNFGYLVDAGKPVVATEWTEPTDTNSPLGNWCKTLALDVPGALLDFLARKHIGVVAYAFDVPNTVVADFNGMPTTYENKRCGDADGGPGVLLRRQFGLSPP